MMTFILLILSLRSHRGGLPDDKVPAERDRCEAPHIWHPTAAAEGEKDAAVRRSIFYGIQHDCDNTVFPPELCCGVFLSSLTRFR
ncbi:MAG: hypothetical protein K5787_02840 [Lentisphaeria bacterium]|nr:hypothetical protein [Victivallales bacterium]MCR4572679.1 hypothetical protein [Lentisphaeria bacterium]